MSPTPDDALGTDTYRALIRSGHYDVEADGLRGTRLTVRTTSTPPRVYEGTYPRDEFLGEHPSLASGAYFHVDIVRGRVTELLTNDDRVAEPEVGRQPVGDEAVLDDGTSAADVDGFALLESLTTGPDAVVHEAAGAYAGFVDDGRVGLAGRVVDVDGGDVRRPRQRPW